jgi:rRNA maturation endonuclease Nob1
MLLTTDFLYMRTKTGTINRIKVDDIDLIKFEKSFIGAQKIVCKAKNEVVELPNGFDKKSAEAAADVILDVVLAIKDKHSAEKMKAIEEANAKRQAIAQAAALEEQRIKDGIGKDTAPKRVIKNPADTDKHGVEVDFSDVGADLEALAADLEKKAAFESSKQDYDDGGFVSVSSAAMNDAATGADALEDQSGAIPENNEYFDGVDVPSLDDVEALPDKADTISDFEIPDDVSEPEVKTPEAIAEDIAATQIQTQAEKSADIQAEKSADAHHPKFCPECGSKIDRPGAKFCMECGAKLN